MSRKGSFGTGRGFSDPAASLFVEDGFLGTPRADRPLPHWLGEADLAYFTESYKESGFRGGLNWYRNLDRNWELTAPWKARKSISRRCSLRDQGIPS
jgi:hypothetical protein